jgi:ABC-type uncharacterized transport system YnjBCD ATPase subunit
MAVYIWLSLGLALLGMGLLAFVLLSGRSGTSRSAAAKGDLVVLMGPNAGGKTVLFHKVGRVQ